VNCTVSKSGLQIEILLVAVVEGVFEQGGQSSKDIFVFTHNLMLKFKTQFL
jgi:hypothetical protein